MGGGASKNKQASAPPITEPPPKVEKESPHIHTIIGHRNGELAPITSIPNFPRATWGDAVPLQPIGTRYTPLPPTLPSSPPPLVPSKSVDTSTPIIPIADPREMRSTSITHHTLSKSPTTSSVPPPSSSSSLSHKSPPTTIVPPSSLSKSFTPSSTLSKSPTDSCIPPPRAPSPVPSSSPTPLSPDPLKNNKTLFLDRKFSDGINSPITQFKKAKEKEGKGGEEEDQVVVDSDDLDEEYDDPSTHKFHKSVADKFYQDVFEKTKSKPAPKESHAPPKSLLAASLTAPSVSFQLSESEDSGDDSSGLYTEYSDKRPSLANSQKKMVPTLQLTGLGEKRKPGTAIVVSNKPPPEVAPVPKNHGNFDNDKFRAANHAKKTATDSIFKQTTYDYKAANKSYSSTSLGSGSSINTPTDTLSSPDFQSSSSFGGYSSDASMDSPYATRPPNTPTHKPAYDDFEETLISSILDE